MKKLGILLLTAALALSISSCQSNNEGTTATAAATEEQVTSAEDNTGAKAPTEAPTAKPAPVAQTETFKSDFSAGAEGWTTYGGTWEVKDGAYTVLADPGAKAIAEGTMFDDFIFEADITVSKGTNGGLVFRVSYPDEGADAYYGYYAGIHPSGVIFGKASDNWTELGAAKLDIGADTEAHVKVVAKGTIFEFYVNDMDNPLLTVDDDEHDIGAIGLRVYQIDAAFKNIVVTPTAK